MRCPSLVMRCPGPPTGRGALRGQAQVSTKLSNGVSWMAPRHQE